jgi:hypothetical protein
LVPLSWQLSQAGHCTSLAVQELPSVAHVPLRVLSALHSPQALAAELQRAEVPEQVHVPPQSPEPQPAPNSAPGETQVPAQQ